MEVLDLSATKNMRCLIVALANGELRVYNGKNLIDTYETNVGRAMHSALSRLLSKQRPN